MIYWFTGQPGHGKTNAALKMMYDWANPTPVRKTWWKFWEKKVAPPARECYVCNVRGFKPELAGMKEMTPEQFIDWPNFLPDGAACLVDEAYEHNMLPKRAPSSHVPHHVQQLAKHRHRGLDFVFVSQSPDKQVDVFVHDLIERQRHVRRRFGTPYLHIRNFDRFERNPEKATPLSITRGTFWKKAFTFYESTTMDTTERNIPWYFIALVIAVPLALYMMYTTFGNMGKRLGGEEPQAIAMQKDGAVFQPEATEPSGDGAARVKQPLTTEQFAAQFVPRIASQPWSAPAYDNMKVSSQPPRVFCMASKAGRGADDVFRPDRCNCVTEQGTKYDLEYSVCKVVAENGQYEPYYQERDDKRGDGVSQQRDYKAQIDRIQGGRYTTRSDTDQGGESVSVSAGEGIGNGRVTESTLTPIGGI